MRRPSLVCLVAIGVLSLLTVSAGPALAKKIVGSKRGEKIVGTNGADRIKGKGGNDLIKGKGGNDRLNGGKGGDKVVGGAGVDGLLGGPGNDLLKAADGRLDSVIDGGTGTNTCVIDTAELSIVRNCANVHAGTPGQAPGGGPAPGPGPGPAQGLRVLSVDVMCSPAPNVLGCSFHITGDGADAAGPGSVDRGGGVTNVIGGAGSLMAPNWDAFGGYTCTAAGFLRVTVGSKSVDVPVPCEPPPPPG